MSRATPLFAVASLAVAAGCSDKPAFTAPAPTRPNAIVTMDPAPTPYSVTVDPPVILQGFAGSAWNSATGVNSLGEVSGYSSLSGVQHAVRWPAGSTSPADVGIGKATTINAAGQLAGSYGVQAALWTPDGSGGYTRTNIGAQLPSPVLSSAYGINASGQVVGTYRVPVSAGVWADKCFLWTPDKPNTSTGTVSTLPDLGGNFCVAADINSAGYVVGASTTSSGETHGFVWSPPNWGRLGKIGDLTPGGGPSYARSINESRQVAGEHTTATTTNVAIWNPTLSGGYVMTELGTFTGTAAGAYDINDAGFVVGVARRNNVTPAEEDAFLWQNGAFTLLPGTTSTSNAMALTGLNGNSVQVIGGSYDGATNANIALRWNVTVAPLGSSAK